MLDKTIDEAQQLLLNDQYQQALECINIVLANSNDSVPALQLKFIILMSIIAEKMPESWDALRNLTSYQDAMVVFEEINKRDANNLKALSTLMGIYNHYPEQAHRCIELARQIISIQKNSEAKNAKENLSLSVAYIVLADAQRELGEINLSIKTCDELLQLMPNCAVALDHQIESYCELAQQSPQQCQPFIDNAVMAFERLLNICERDFHNYDDSLASIHTTNYRLLKNCLSSLARKNTSSENLKQYLLQKIESINSLYSVAIPLNNQRNLAYEHFKAASTTNISHEAINLYQSALAIMNDFATHSLNSNDNRFYLQINAALGDIYYADSNWRQARSAYADAIEHERNIAAETDEDYELLQHCQERKRDCDHSLDRKHTKAYGVPIPKPLQKALRNDPIARYQYALAASNSMSK